MSSDNGSEGTEMVSNPSATGKFGVTRQQLSELTNCYTDMVPSTEDPSVKLSAAELLLADKYGNVEDLAKLLKVDTSRGISPSEAKDRSLIFGINMLPEDPLPSFCQLFLEQLQDFTMIMLSVAGIFSFILGISDPHEREEGGYVEGLAIIFTVVLVGMIGAGTDHGKNKLHKAQQAAQNQDETVRVFRDGVQSPEKGEGSMSKFDCVVGDIIQIEIGDVMPADCVFVSGDDLKLDEGSLTGEPDLKKKNAKHPFLLAGTGVRAGSGRVMIVAVGQNSLGGSISMATRGKAEYTPMEGNISVTNGASYAVFTPDSEELNIKDFQKHIEGFNKVKIGNDDGSYEAEVVTVVKKDDSEDWQLELTIPWEYETMESAALYSGTLESSKGRSVLEAKLDKMAKSIGYMGMVAAAVTMIAMTIKWTATEFGTIGRAFFSQTYYGGSYTDASNVQRRFYTESTVEAQQRFCYWNVWNGTGYEPVLGGYDAHMPGVAQSTYNNTLVTEGCDTLLAAQEHFSDTAYILEIVITGITVLVVAIPEGLPLAVILALVYSSNKMQEEPNNCFVKHLDACETMGNATAICSDKTGTLTQNKMRVKKTYIGGQIRSNPIAASSNEVSDTVKAILAESLVLNTKSVTNVIRDPEGSKPDKYDGNATECALLGYAMDCQFDAAGLRQSPDSNGENGNKFLWPNGVKLFPFSSSLKRMSIVVPRFDEDGNVIGTRIYTKGASEIVLNTMVTSILNADGSVEAIDEADLAERRSAINEASIKPFADEALRTIGVAYKDLEIMPDALVGDIGGGGASDDGAEGESVTYWSQPDLDQGELTTDMTLVGIFGIYDAIRPEVPDAVANCHSAGITVRMCTGDNIATASAIAHQTGLIEDAPILETRRIPDPNNPEREIETPVLMDVQGNVIGMEGIYFRHLVYNPVTNALLVDPDTGAVILDSYWPKLRVLARCRPNDKFVLVKGLMDSQLFQDKATKFAKDGNIGKYAEVVAVTGDGTNDAPALSTANVGFAMGIAGTKIAKDACDIILKDDNFKSIVQAVKWGRNVYDSIGKFLQFQLTVNVVAIFIAFVGSAVIGESPLKAVQLLWVNLIMDSFASLALATEPPTDALLERKPIGKTKGLISKRILRFIVSSAIYQIVVLLIILFNGCQGEIGCTNGFEGDCTGFLRCENAVGQHSTRPTVHFTIMFNVFVLMQIFNEINARMLHDEINVFKGITKNCIFVGIWIGTLVVQFVIVQLVNYNAKGYNQVFTTRTLDAGQWGYNLLFGAGALVWGIFTRVIINPSVFEKCAKKSDYSKEALDELRNDDHPSIFDSKLRKNDIAITGDKQSSSAPGLQSDEWA